MKLGVFFRQKLLAEAFSHYLNLKGLNAQLVENEDGARDLDLLLIDYTTLLRVGHRLEEKVKLILIDTGLNDLHKKLAFFLYGIQGIISLDTSWTLLEKALQEVYKGATWFERAFLNEILSFYKSPRTARSFSQREKEILFWICLGLKNEEIAKTLNISVSTVKTTISKLLKKLNLKRRNQLQTALMSSALWGEIQGEGFFQGLRRILQLEFLPKRSF